MRSVVYGYSFYIVSYIMQSLQVVSHLNAYTCSIIIYQKKTENTLSFQHICNIKKGFFQNTCQKT